MTDEEYYANVLALLVAIETERKDRSALWQSDIDLVTWHKAVAIDIQNTDRLSKLLAEETDRRVNELSSGLTKPPSGSVAGS